MKAVIWLILFLLAAVGAAAIVDYTGVYDVPMVEVSEQSDIASE